MEDIRAAIAAASTTGTTSTPHNSGQWRTSPSCGNLAVIGEAVRSLPDDFKQAHAGPPWPSIAGLPNVVVLECFRVNPDLIRTFSTTKQG